MKLNSELKNGGLIILVLFIFLLIGLTLEFVLKIHNTLTLILASPLYFILVIGALLYWVYHLTKHQNTQKPH